MRTSAELDGYQYLPGSTFASGAVLASDGFTIERAVLSALQPLQDGFRTIESHLASIGRPIGALCGIELRSPQTLPAEAFRAFNGLYNAQLESWGLIRDERSPLARTNVAPVTREVETPSLAAFSYTTEAPGSAPSYVVSGTAELRDGARYPDDIVLPGEASPAALSEKLRVVVQIVLDRLAAAGTVWDDAATVHLYSSHAVDYELQHVVLPEFGISPVHGVISHATRPPVQGLELEIDVRRYNTEWFVDLA